jgi:hypothetical protein
VLRSLARGRSACDAAALRKAYVNALAERLALTSATLSRRGSLAHVLRRSGVTEPVAAEADALLATLDDAAFAPDVHVPPEIRRRLFDVYRLVDREARPRIVVPPGVIGVLLATIAVVSMAHAIVAAEPPVAAFTRGLALYQARHFVEAERSFSAVAADVPRAADAWANFGTAAWAAGDSAAAVVGWQRALRLEPLAGDMRERLDLLAAPQNGAIAGVRPIPLSAVAAAALACWLLAWSLLAYRAARGNGSPGRWASLTGITAIALGALAVDVRRTVLARDLVVIADASPLRALPALGAEQSETRRTGEVARAVGQQGVWTRVQLDGDREGWVETERLVSIEQR